MPLEWEFEWKTADNHLKVGTGSENRLNGKSMMQKVELMVKLWTETELKTEIISYRHGWRDWIWICIDPNDSPSRWVSLISGKNIQMVLSPSQVIYVKMFRTSTIFFSI